MPSIADLEAQLHESEQKRQEAEDQVRAIQLAQYKEQRAQEIANMKIAAMTKTRDDVDAEIEARAQEIADAQAGKVLTSHLSKIRVTGKIELPGEIQREGNLPPWQKQLLDITLRRKTALVAMTTTTDADGGYWVPTELSAELINYIRLNNLLVPFFNQVEMPSETYEMPVSVSGATIEYRGEGSAATESKPVLSKLTLNAKKLIGRVPFSYELEESSIIPILPWLRDELGRNLGDAEELAVVFGDDTTTAASNQDKNITGVEPNCAFNGLWYTTRTGAATWFVAYSTSWDASLTLALSAMGKYALNPRDLIWVTPTYVLNKLRTATNFSTYDKAGPFASILSGTLPNPSNVAAYGNYYGSPVVPTAQLPLTNNVGVKLTTAGSNTYYNAMCVNYRRVWFGRVRSGIRIEMFRDVEAQLNKLVISERVALGIPDGGTSGVIYGVKAGA